jgi:hypothetical protein
MRTSFRHQSEAQPPNGPLTAAASPDTPSRMPSHAVRSPPARLDYSTFLLWRGAAWRVAAPRTPMPDLKRRLSGAYTSALAEALASVTECGLA